MLDNNLASEGIHHTSNTRSGGSVFVATYPGSTEKTDRDGKERDLEASTDAIVPLEKISVSQHLPG
jgi:hypothetical protein